MGFLSSVGHFLGNLFGGGDNSDEEKKKKQQQQFQTQQRPTFIQQPQQTQTQFGGIQTPQKADNFLNLVQTNGQQNNGGQPPLLQKAQAPTPEQQKQAELDKLTQANMDQARKDSQQGENWFERTFLNRGADEKRAEVLARNRATSQYQDQHGWVKDPTVLKFGDTTLQKANQNSADSQASLDRINKVADVATKTQQVAGNIPVVGSILKLENDAIGGIGSATGNDYLKNTSANIGNELSLGMSTDELNKLDPEQQRKLGILKTADNVLAPLDFLGLTSLAKAPVVAGLRQGAKETIKNTAEKGLVTAAKDGLISDSSKQLIKAGIKEQGKQAAIGFGIGSGVSAGGQQWLAGNVDPWATLHGGLVGGSIAMLTPGGTLRKAVNKDKPPVVSETRVVPQPDEVSAGIKSANPTELEDAAAQTAREAGQSAAEATDGTNTQVAQGADGQPAISPEAQQRVNELRAQAEDTSTPAYQRKGAKTALAAAQDAANNEAAIKLGVADTPSDTLPAFQFKRQMQDVVDQANQEFTDYVNSNPGLSQQELEVAQENIKKQALDRIAQMQAERAGTAIEATTPSEPAPVIAAPNPMAVGDQAAQVADVAAPVAPTADQVPAAAVEPAPAPEAQAIQPAPEMPVAADQSQPGANMVDAAPRSHDALVKSLGPSAEKMKGQYSQRESINLDELKQRAEAQIANMSDQQVLQSFQTAGPETMIRDSNSFALARAALDKLAKHPEDPAMTQAVTNIMDAMDRYVSKSGEGLRIAQEEFDNMPLPMKVRYIVKKIDALNSDTKNYISLAEDPAKATRIENEITYHLENSQGISERVAALEGRLQNIAEMAKNGEASPDNIKTITKQLTAEKRKLAQSNGELAKYFQSLVPGRTKGQKALADFPRTMMLASFAGRVNDILTTGSNVAHQMGTNFTQGLLSKAVNFVRPGTVTDTSAGKGRLLTGAIEGTRRTAGEVGGAQYVDNLQKALKGNTELRSGLQKATNPIARTVQAATEFATNLSEGVRDQRLYQLALQEADQAGVPKNLRKQYAEARAATPSRNMTENAHQLHMEINNLNENPVTRGLNRLSASIGGNSAVGGLLKNQVIPFTSWLGGNIWNSVTDRNVVASAIKLAHSAGKGDAEGVVRNLAKTINGATQAYALGYVLTQMGLITNQNAAGYNDDGAYFHIGDRYIPVGFLGAFAPNIVLGNAAYHGLNDHPDGSVGQKIVDTAVPALGNMFQSVALANALGQENNLSRAYDASQRKGGVTTGEGLAAGGATLASGAGGQFLPGTFGDANAILNNGIPGITGLDKLNPTHEAADTKAVDPNSPSGKATDIPKTAFNQFLNRIPGVSQLAFPRKAGVAANDMVDRVTRGDRETSTQIQAKADAQKVANQSADFAARGIPDPNSTEKGYSFNDAVTNAADNGKFDAAIEGLDAKLKNLNGDKNSTKEQKQKVQDQISEYKALKDGGFTTQDYAIYKSIGVSDWRKLGDPESEYYNKDAYDKLWAIDQALAKNGVGLGTGLNKGKQKYSAKKSGRGGSGGSSRVKSNTIGSIPELGKVTFGNLVGKQTGTPAIPQVQPIKAKDLIKKRKITVTK